MAVFATAPYAYARENEKTVSYEDASEQTYVQYEGWIGNARWSIDSAGVLTIGQGEINNTEPMMNWPWSAYAESIRRVDGTAAFKASGFMDGAFYNCANMESADFSGWDTSGAVSMNGMFTSCESLVSLDLSMWNTSNVHDMSGMFANDPDLESLNLAGWDLGVCQSLNSTFYNCPKLTSLDVRGWDTSKISRMYDVFFWSDALCKVRYCQSALTLIAQLPETEWYQNDNGPFLTSEIPALETGEGALLVKASAKTKIDGAVITGIGKTYIETGNAIEPIPVVTLDGNVLQPDRDYVLTYDDNILPGSARVRIRGIGEYAGEIEAFFEIVKKPESPKKSLAQAQISGMDVSYAFTGKAIKPEVRVTIGEKRLVQDRDYTIAYSQNVQPGTALITISGIGNYTGVRTITFQISEPEDKVETIDMHRLYNPHSSEHFYTGSMKEKDYLVSLGWKYEGRGWIAPEISQTPVFRLYNRNAGDHHYTMNSRERDALIKLGWTYEDIGWYSDDDQGTPLYRQYNPNAKAGSHNYTISKMENDFLVSAGWKAEGISWYGVKK